MSSNVLPQQSMAGKVVLVTGATDGIGKITVRELARLGATVVGVGRNPQKAAAVEQEIRSLYPNADISFQLADLSSMAEVRRVASEFKSKHNRLDVLINNAGAIFFDYGVTEDGYERTFALNHLAYFVLTHELLDLLKASAPSRIVNVSSDAHTAGKINFDDLQHVGYGSGGAFPVYGQSKLANVLFSNELARRLTGTGVTSNALHPGFVRSQFGHSGPWYITGSMGFLQGIFAITPEQGAATTLHLATAPEVEGVTGKYFSKSKATTPHARALDEAVARRLWEVSEQLVARVATQREPVLEAAVP
ncbi:MAG: SDR family oxidoreductase [Caldilineaceae bacterium]